MSQPIPVNSSWVQSVHWEGGVLTVRTRRGDSYSFYGVPESLWEQLQGAPSKGHFINQHIKGRYAQR